MTTAPRTLVQMWNRPTAYEIVARHEDGDEIRLGFSERHTKSALLNAITDNNREALHLQRFLNLDGNRIAVNDLDAPRMRAITRLR